ncbi:MAG: hypothetical protein AB2595_05095 [Candidatus Thiodiazotropha endolucinida]
MVRLFLTTLLAFVLLRLVVLARLIVGTLRIFTELKLSLLIVARRLPGGGGDCV